LTSSPTSHRPGYVVVVGVVGVLLGAGIVWSPATMMAVSAVPIFIAAFLYPDRTALVLLPLTPLYNAVVVRVSGVMDIRILELIWLTVALGMLGRVLRRRDVGFSRIPVWIVLVGARAS